MSNTRWSPRLVVLVSMAVLSVGAVMAAVPGQSGATGPLRGIGIRVENSSPYLVKAESFTSVHAPVGSNEIKPQGNAVQATETRFLTVDITCVQYVKYGIPRVTDVKFENPLVGTPEVSWFPSSRPHSLAEGKWVTMTSRGISFYIERKPDDTYTTSNAEKTKSYIVRVTGCEQRD